MPPPSQYHRNSRPRQPAVRRRCPVMFRKAYLPILNRVSSTGDSPRPAAFYYWFFHGDTSHVFPSSPHTDESILRRGDGEGLYLQLHSKLSGAASCISRVMVRHDAMALLIIMLIGCWDISRRGDARDIRWWLWHHQSFHHSLIPVLVWEDRWLLNQQRWDSIKSFSYFTDRGIKY